MQRTAGSNTVKALGKYAAIALIIVMGLRPSAATAGGIAGIIRDGATSLPIAGIDLDLFDSSFSPVGVNAVSAADGSYLLSPLGAGQYYLRADPNAVQGYVDRYYPGVFLKSLATPIIVSEFGSVIVDFSLATGSNITGTITAVTTGLPIAGMDLDLYAGDKSFIGSINAGSQLDGTYLIGALPAGNFFLRADPAGSSYVMNYYLNQADLATATPIVSDGVTDRVGIDFAMDLAGSISGTLTNAVTSAPADSVDLDLFDTTGAFLSAYNAKTALDGTYTLSSVPAGSYFLQADPTIDQPYVDTYYGNVFDRRLATPVVVTAGLASLGVDIALPPGGTLSGRVTAAATGVPLAGIRISVFDSLRSILPGLGGSTLTDGTFRVGAMPAGIHYLRAAGDSLSGLAFQFYAGAIKTSAATPVTAIPGTDIGSINLALAAGGWLTGTVREAGTAVPLSLIDLDVYTPDLEFIGALDAETDPAGNFVLGPVPAGDFIVRAQPALGSTFLTQYYDHSPDTTLAVPITVTPIVTVLAIDFDLLQGLSAVGNPLPSVRTADLVGAYPNPFNPTTRIVFELAVAGKVDLAVYDLRGSRLATLVSGEQSAGHHEVKWLGVTDAGRSVSSGVYLLQLTVGNQTDRGKLMLVR